MLRGRVQHAEQADLHIDRGRQGAVPPDGVHPADTEVGRGKAALQQHQKRLVVGAQQVVDAGDDDRDGPGRRLDRGQDLLHRLGHQILIAAGDDVRLADVQVGAAVAAVPPVGADGHPPAAGGGGHMKVKGLRKSLPHRAVDALGHGGEKLQLILKQAAAFGVIHGYIPPAWYLPARHSTAPWGSPGRPPPRS